MKKIVVVKVIQTFHYMLCYPFFLLEITFLEK